MATKVFNECCDCAVPGYPCLGEYCSRRRVKRYFCDRCDEQVEDEYGLTRMGGVDLCSSCFDELYGD